MPVPRHAGGSSFPPPAFSLDVKIEDEEWIVDAMLASLARGRLSSDAWDQLHAAARRDSCVDGIASAFATVSSGPRIKSAQPAVAAEFLFQAARYCDEVQGDDLAAAIHLERCLELAPAHGQAFAKMESILNRRRRPDMLAQLYAASAPHRPRGQQALMLRRAAEWLAQAGEEGREPQATSDGAIGMWEEIVRLEPADDEARSRLEALYVKAGRFRDAVRLNEQSLARDPAPDEYSKGLILERIVSLYSDRLDQPERALPYVEQILSADPKHPGARAVAERLLSVKGLAGRAAAALALASGTDAPHEVERYLSIELESAHGSRRTQLLARLGRLREEELGDAVGALEAYDQALALDPANEEARSRYVAVATRLECHADAVKVIERVLAAVKEPSIVLRANVELGEALLGQRNAKRAKTVLVEVLSSLSAPPDVQLRAARALRTIYEATYDRRALCDVLDRIAHLEDDADRRQEANLRLAAEALKLKDPRRAVEAYERLLSSGARAEALEALSKLYRGRDQREKYARILDAQAYQTDDDKQARAMMLRSAEVRTREVKDAAAAIGTYQALLRRFGQDRDVLALLLPLLEGEGRWAEMAEALAQDAALAPRAERAVILARMGVLRLERLGNAGSAIDAFAEALVVDEREPTARAMLEKLAAAGEHRAAAARALEPVQRH